MDEERIYDIQRVTALVGATELLEPGEAPSYWLYNCHNGTPSGYIAVDHIDVRIKRPTLEELRPTQVAAFREEIEKTRAAAERKVQELEEQLKNLLALSYSAVGV